MTTPSPNAHVIVVDDESINLTIMRLTLEEKNFRVTTFSSAESCLAELKGSNLLNYDCMVTDHSMPGISGLELLEEIKKLDPTLEVIMVTGENERMIIKESLRKGAFDFLDKPLDPNKFHSTVQNAIKASAIRRKRDATEASLVAARSTGLFAEFNPDSVSLPIERIYTPKHELGGDFIDITEHNPEHLSIVLGDISGHDIQSALLSSHFLGTLYGRRSIESPLKADELLKDYNLFLIQKRQERSSAGSMSVGSSLSVCNVELINREVRIINCGNPPVYLQKKNGSILRVAPRYQPLGWFDIEEFESQVIDAENIQKMVLFTDGMVEHAKKHECDILSLLHHLDTLNKSDQQEFLLTAEDDILSTTVIMHEDESVVLPLVYNEYSGNEQSKIDRFQKFWRNSILLVLENIDNHLLHRFILACREGVINALKHGCSGRPDCIASFEIRANLQNRELEAVIKDPGEGHAFDYVQRDANFKDMNPGSLGLVLISKLVDEMELLDNGATMKLRLRV